MKAIGDLPVFAADRLDEVSEACAEASLCAGIEKKESVEPLMRDADPLFYTDSYVLTRAVQEGEEVYSMAEDELAQQGARNALRLAEEYLDLTRSDLEGDQLRGAADAGYNASEFCVKGLLMLTQQKLPRTHGGIVQKFSEVYVQRAVRSNGNSGESLAKRSNSATVHGMILMPQSPSSRPSKRST